MKTAHLIDGKALAGELNKSLQIEVEGFKKETGVTPTLAAIRIGDDAASKSYVSLKRKRMQEVGMASEEFHFAENTPVEEIGACIEKLNQDPKVHGILLQLPLPDRAQTDLLIDKISPIKDVDGVHPDNIGRLVVSKPRYIPCTPYGCLLLLHHTLDELEGKKAVLIGVSDIIGKPMAQLLLQENCTVSMTHIFTKNIAEECRTADILISATGVPGLVKKDWVKEGACVLDVGISRVENENGVSFVGDVDFDEVSPVAGHLTPVPGGVGPMTIACLLKNTFLAAQNQTGVSPHGAS